MLYSIYIYIWHDYIFISICIHIFINQDILQHALKVLCIFVCQPRFLSGLQDVLTFPNSSWRQWKIPRFHEQFQPKGSLIEGGLVSKIPPQKKNNRPFRCLKHCKLQGVVVIFFQKPPPPMVARSQKRLPEHLGWWSFLLLGAGFLPLTTG